MPELKVQCPKQSVPSENPMGSNWRLITESSPLNVLSFGLAARLRENNNNNNNNNNQEAGCKPFPLSFWKGRHFQRQTSSPEQQQEEQLLLINAHTETSGENSINFSPILPCGPQIQIQLKLVTLLRQLLAQPEHWSKSSGPKAEV